MRQSNTNTQDDEKLIDELKNVSRHMTEENGAINKLVGILTKERLAKAVNNYYLRSKLRDLLSETVIAVQSYNGCEQAKKYLSWAFVYLDIAIYKDENSHRDYIPHVLEVISKLKRLKSDYSDLFSDPELFQIADLFAYEGVAAYVFLYLKFDMNNTNEQRIEKVFSSKLIDGLYTAIKLCYGLYKVPMNKKRAFELLEAAIKNNMNNFDSPYLPMAYLFFATMYSEGLGTIPDKDKELGCYTTILRFNEIPNEILEFVMSKLESIKQQKDKLISAKSAKIMGDAYYNKKVYSDSSFFKATQLYKDAFDNDYYAVGHELFLCYFNGYDNKNFTPNHKAAGEVATKYIESLICAGQFMSVVEGINKFSGYFQQSTLPSTFEKEKLYNLLLTKYIEQAKVKTLLYLLHHNALQIKGYSNFNASVGNLKEDILNKIYSKILEKITNKPDSLLNVVNEYIEKEYFNYALNLLQESSQQVNNHQDSDFFYNLFQVIKNISEKSGNNKVALLNELLKRQTQYLQESISNPKRTVNSIQFFSFLNHRLRLEGIIVAKSEILNAWFLSIINFSWYLLKKGCCEEVISGIKTLFGKLESHLPPQLQNDAKCLNQWVGSVFDDMGISKQKNLKKESENETERAFYHYKNITINSSPNNNSFISSFSLFPKNPPQTDHPSFLPLKLLAENKNPTAMFLLGQYYMDRITKGNSPVDDFNFACQWFLRVGIADPTHYFTRKALLELNQFSKNLTESTVLEKLRDTNRQNAVLSWHRIILQNVLDPSPILNFEVKAEHQPLFFEYLIQFNGMKKEGFSPDIIRTFAEIAKSFTVEACKGEASYGISNQQYQTVSQILEGLPTLYPVLGNDSIKFEEPKSNNYSPSAPPSEEDNAGNLPDKNNNFESLTDIQKRIELLEEKNLALEKLLLAERNKKKPNKNPQMQKISKEEVRKIVRDEVHLFAINASKQMMLFFTGNQPKIPETNNVKPSPEKDKKYQHRPFLLEHKPRSLPGKIGLLRRCAPPNDGKHKTTVTITKQPWR